MQRLFGVSPELKYCTLEGQASSLEIEETDAGGTLSKLQFLVRVSLLIFAKVSETFVYLKMC